MGLVCGLQEGIRLVLGVLRQMEGLRVPLGLRPTKTNPWLMFVLQICRTKDALAKNEGHLVEKRSEERWCCDDLLYKQVQDSREEKKTDTYRSCLGLIRYRPAGACSKMTSRSIRQAVGPHRIVAGLSPPSLRRVSWMRP